MVPPSERFVDAKLRQQKGKGVEIGEEGMMSLTVIFERRGSELSYTSAAIELPDQYEYAVWCSFVEVYNENIHDLLSLEVKPKNLALKQDHKHSDNKFVAGATSVRLWSEQVSQPLQNLLEYSY